MTSASCRIGPVHAGALLGCALLSACGADLPPKAPPAHEHDQSASVGHDEEEPAEFEGCPEDTPSFEPGMTSNGSRIRASLLSASKTPPERYLNDWVVELVDESGARLTDAQVERARPFMPIHGHDGNIQPVIRLREPGVFALDRLNFNMRGPWEVQLGLKSPSAGEDDVVFRICVEE
jgi:hypothetical protein